MESVIPRLIQRRKARGWLAEDIADRLGVSHRNIVSRWECGVGDASFHNLLAWVRMLDMRTALVPADETFTPDGRVAYAMDDQTEILRAMTTRRLELDLSLTQVAESLGSPGMRRAVGQWEAGTTNRLRTHNLRKWIQALGMDLIHVDHRSPLAVAWDEDFRFTWGSQP